MRSSIILAAGVTLAATAGAQTPLTTTRIINGLNQPTFVTHAPGDYERLFIVEQDGFIQVLRDGVLQPRPFLDIDNIVGSTQNEQGLLGLAFHPDYQSNGYFFVCFTNNGGTSVVRRYSVDPNDPNVATTADSIRVITLSQPNDNHNGGWIGFGPDAYLYIAFGDGGSGCDPGENAQDRGNLLGTIARIDVDQDDFPDDPAANYSVPPDNPFIGVAGALPEIWAWGLRNPWRCSFDRELGDLYIADVGQQAREELNFQSTASTGGENYGWDCQEGLICSSSSNCTVVGCDCTDAQLVRPFRDYNHGGGRCSVTGGYVYRGCAIPDLAGAYFYGDFCSGQLWSLRFDGTTETDFVERTAELDPPGAPGIGLITSFGEDAYGELYIVDRSGEIFKIVPAGGIVGADCNTNGIDDACDIRSGLATDRNGNGVPDTCECIGDVMADGDVDLDDLLQLLNSFAGSGVPAPGGDADGDGDTDLDDLLLLLGNFGCTA